MSNDAVNMYVQVFVSMGVLVSLCCAPGSGIAVSNGNSVQPFEKLAPIFQMFFEMAVPFSFLISSV